MLKQYFLINCRSKFDLKKVFSVLQVMPPRDAGGIDQGIPTPKIDVDQLLRRIGELEQEREQERERVNRLERDLQQERERVRQLERKLVEQEQIQTVLSVIKGTILV